MFTSSYYHFFLNNFSAKLGKIKIQEGHDGSVRLNWVKEPDLELIEANILTKIHDDYINK